MVNNHIVGIDNEIVAWSCWCPIFQDLQCDRRACRKIIAHCKSNGWIGFVRNLDSVSLPATGSLASDNHRAAWGLITAPGSSFRRERRRCNLSNLRSTILIGKHHHKNAKSNHHALWTTHGDPHASSLAGSRTICRGVFKQNPKVFYFDTFRWVYRGSSGLGWSPEPCPFFQRAT